MRWSAILPLVLVGAPLAATELGSLDVRVRADESGTGRVSGTLRLEGATAGAVAVPVGFPAVTGLQLTDAPPGAAVLAEQQNGQTILRVTLPEGVPASISVGFGFTVADLFQRPTPKPGESSASVGVDRRLFRHALLNSQPGTIGAYRFELVFPSGTRAHAIREAAPKLRAGEAGPRAQLDEIDGQDGVRLRVDRLVQGETASIQVELVPRSRTAAWLLAGVALSLLYLVRFRDLVARAS